MKKKSMGDCMQAQEEHFKFLYFGDLLAYREQAKLREKYKN
jgi:hypothetical protein